MAEQVGEGSGDGFSEGLVKGGGAYILDPYFPESPACNVSSTAGVPATILDFEAVRLDAKCWE